MPFGSDAYFTICFARYVDTWPMLLCFDPTEAYAVLLRSASSSGEEPHKAGAAPTATRVYVTVYSSTVPAFTTTVVDN